MIRMKQVTSVAGTLLVSAATLALAAPAEQPVPAEDDRGVEIIIRPAAERKPAPPPQDVANSAPQTSDTPADSPVDVIKDQPAEPAEAGDDGWYEYLFGQRQNADKQSERDWYEYLFGKRKPPKETQDKDSDTDSSRWWPFD